MANTIDTLVLQNDGVYYRVRYQCLSDGTGADLTDAVVVDKSTLTALATNAEPDALDLIEFTYGQAWSLTRVELEWDHTTDDEIIAFGPQCDVRLSHNEAPLNDPRSAGATGDVVVTTKGMAANGGFFFIATFKLRAGRT